MFRDISYNLQTRVTAREIVIVLSGVYAAADDRSERCVVWYYLYREQLFL